jgi:hypothetical protein
VSLQQSTDRIQDDAYWQLSGRVSCFLLATAPSGVGVDESYKYDEH